MFAIKPSIGIVNLHTGLSPYVKGGPNCTNWCLANNDLHLIGNTIMWLNEGIDTGNIITTDFVHFTEEKTLSEIHHTVMEQAHELYLKAIAQLSVDPVSVSNVPQQSIAKGKTYYTKMWGLKEKSRLVKNLRNFSAEINTEKFRSAREQTIIVPVSRLAEVRFKD
jgi:methionyl-tRNA formyltransferase